MFHEPLAVWLALASVAFPVQDRPPESEPPAPAPQSIEDEVVGNIVGQTLGAGKVADLALPADFLGRVADRIIRSSYAERYRAIVRDPNEPAEASSKPGEPAAGEPRTHDELAAGEPPAAGQPAADDLGTTGQPAAGGSLATGAAAGSSTSEAGALEPGRPDRTVGADVPVETAPAVPARRSVPAWAFAVAGGAVVLVLLLAVRGARAPTR